MNRCDRAGLSIPELSIAMVLGLALLGTAVSLMTQGARHSRDLIAANSGLADLSLARLAFERDGSGVPPGRSPRVTPSRVTLDVASGLGAGGTVSVSPVEYRLDGPPGQLALIRQGHRIAGPFLNGRFELSRDLTGNPLLRIVLEAPAGRAGMPTPLIVQIPVPTDRTPPGLLVAVSP